MSEEEKKAIEILETFDLRRKTKNYREISLEDSQSVKIILNLIEKLQKGNEELKKLHIQDNKHLDFIMENSILIQKVKSKIEELNKKEQKLQSSISAEEREEYSDANISWDLMNINIKREVLQDLIEGRK
jgi:hypothetical protein